MVNKFHVQIPKGEVDRKEVVGRYKGPPPPWTKEGKALKKKGKK